MKRLLFACLAGLLLTGCADIVYDPNTNTYHAVAPGQDYVPQQNPPASPEKPPVDNGPISHLIAGTWVGTIHYAMANGSSFDTAVNAQVIPGKRIVNLKVGDSDTQTMASQTVEAHRAGMVGVTFSSTGTTSVTEITLQRLDQGHARVTSQVIGNGAILATGTGILERHG